MNFKKTILKIFILTISVIIIGTFHSSVQASMWTTAQNWLTIGKDNSDFEVSGDAEEEISGLAGLLFGVGIGVGLIAMAGLGISYMLASSAESKSSIKEKAIVVAVGIFVLVCSFTIWKVLIETLSSGT